jgi:hypothetical protein
MLIIAIAYGSQTDPFTTSASIPMKEAAEQGLDPSNAQHMLDWICDEKSLDDKMIDCVLVVYEDAVQHNHTDFT